MKSKQWIAGACLALGGALCSPGVVRAQEEEITLTDSSVIVLTDAAGRLVPVEGQTRPSGAERFWADPANGTIRRGPLDGSRGSELVSGLQMPYGLTYDALGAAFVWTSSGEETVQKLTFGETRPRSLRSEFEEPFALVVAGKSGETTYAAIDGQVLAIVHRLESDTEELVVLATYDPELTPVHGLALDEANGVLYVGDLYGRMVQRIDLATREAVNLSYVLESFGDSTAEVVR